MEHHAYALCVNESLGIYTVAVELDNWRKICSGQEGKRGSCFFWTARSCRVLHFVAFRHENPTTVEQEAAQRHCGCNVPLIKENMTPCAEWPTHQPTCCVKPLTCTIASKNNRKGAPFLTKFCMYMRVPTLTTVSSILGCSSSGFSRYLSRKS